MGIVDDLRGDLLGFVHAENLGQAKVLIQDMIDQSYDNGYDDGYNDGLDRGYEEAMEDINE